MFTISEEQVSRLFRKTILETKDGKLVQEGWTLPFTENYHEEVLFWGVRAFTFYEKRKLENSTVLVYRECFVSPFFDDSIFWGRTED